MEAFHYDKLNSPEAPFQIVTTKITIVQTLLTNPHPTAKVLANRNATYYTVDRRMGMRVEISKLP